MSEYSVKRLERNQFELLIPLMKNCFGMDVDIEYFKWKFLDNPAGHFIGFVAVDEQTDEVAAYYGVIPEKYFIEGKEKTIYQSGDTMTHSNHRRRGLFQKLAVHCYQYLKDDRDLFVIGFGGEISTPGLIKMGWRKVLNFQYLFVPKVLCYPTLLSKPADRIEIVSDLHALNSLIETQPSAKIQAFRNADHLSWRLGNPRHSYKVLAYRNDGIEGYVCYCVDNNKIFLFDFVFTSQNSRNSLLKVLKREVVKQNLKGIVAFCAENSPPAVQLKQSGFLNNPLGRGFLSATPPFMFFADEEIMNKFAAPPDCWAVTGYDYDA